jgi:molybdenum-dependent DNA-binding transcriptional regulator ModE
MFQINEDTTKYYNLRSLEFFWMVVKTGSYTYAAKCLNVSQPAVSAAILKMEKNIECSLLLRGGLKQIRLTDEGRRLYIYAENTFSKQRQQILNPIQILNKKKFEHRVVLSNTLPGDAFLKICENCEAYTKLSNKTISITSLNILEAVEKYNDDYFSVIVIPNTGIGTSLALQDTLLPFPVVENVEIYAVKNNLDYLAKEESTLVILRSNFHLMGMNISYMSSPVLVDTYEELIYYLLKQSYYTMLTSHQLKLISLYSIILIAVVRKKISSKPDLYRIFSDKNENYPTYFQYGITSQTRSLDILQVILKII